MPEAAKGRFIVLEGGEGTGKSTHCAALARRLRGVGFQVIETREPGGTPGAEAVRHLLKTGAVEKLGAMAEAVMISAARADHVAAVIRPALAVGRWVVCDRFSDSTKVYQGAGSGVPADVIDALETVAVGETRPDLVLVLDAPAEVGMRRASERGGQGSGDPDRFERESLAFHRKLRAAFRDIARNDPARHVLIDATRPREGVEEAIWASVKQKLGVGADTARREVAAASGACGPDE